jgi:hypothetical protein
MATPFLGKDSQLNADAVVTMPGVAGIFNYATMILCSYTIAVAGRLTVKNGTTSVFDTDIMIANPGAMVFEGYNILRSDAGNALEIRLGSGGLTVTAKVVVMGYTTDTYQ